MSTMRSLITYSWVIGIIVGSQNAPCYQCERYKDKHTEAHQYKQIGPHCTFPCDCPVAPVSCPGGGAPLRDGCGCCLACPRSLGEPCGGAVQCTRGLHCRFSPEEITGTCQANVGLPCVIQNDTYSHGETFRLDCRTQCSCQNGTYACASLCPQENISPAGTCSHPRLVEVPGQCCREWLCDPPSLERPPLCYPEVERWSKCSQHCGVGVATRRTNENPHCHLLNETRICQERPCRHQMRMIPGEHHHVRRGHECKATHRAALSRLRVGPCTSRKRFRPKVCGICADPNKCCRPVLSTTIKVELICTYQDAPVPEDDLDVILDLLEPGAEMWTPENQIKSESEVSIEKSENSDPSENSEELKNLELIEKFYPIINMDEYENSNTNSIKNKDKNIQINHKKYFAYEQNKFSGPNEYRKADESRITVRVQWILKCQCENCSNNGKDITNKVKSKKSKGRNKKNKRRNKKNVKNYKMDQLPIPTTVQGYVVLHRVHRTTLP